MQNKKTKLIVINAIVAALYVVVTSLTAFMSFGNIQFRIAEMLNHLFAATIALITINFVFLFCMLLPPSFLLRDGFEPHRQKNRHELLYYKPFQIGSHSFKK